MAKPVSEPYSIEDLKAYLSKAVFTASEIVENPDADSTLVTLMLMQEAINNAVKDAKKLIEDRALKRTADFKGIRSDNVVISYRPSGSKYKASKGVDPATLPPEYVKASTRYFLQASPIELYYDKHGKFPKGVEAAERNKSIIIDVIDHGEKEIQD